MSKFNFKNFSKIKKVAMMKKEAMSLPKNAIPKGGRGIPMREWGIIIPEENSATSHIKSDVNQMFPDSELDQGRSGHHSLAASDSHSKPMKTQDVRVLHRQYKEYAVRYAFCESVDLEIAPVKDVAEATVKFLEQKFANNPIELGKTKIAEKIGIIALEKQLSRGEKESISRQVADSNILNSTYKMVEKQINKQIEKDESEGRDSTFSRNSLSEMKRFKTQKNMNGLLSAMNKETSSEHDKWIDSWKTLEKGDKDFANADPSRFRFNESKFKELLDGGLSWLPEEIKNLKVDMSNDFYDTAKGPNGEIINKELLPDSIFKTWDAFKGNNSEEKNDMISGKSEMQMLISSIKATKKSIDNGTEYDFKEYLLEAAKDDPEILKMYDTVNALQLQMQPPTWYSIGWHHSSGDTSGEDKSMTKEKSRTIDDLEDLSFYDLNTGGKKTTIKKNGKTYNTDKTPHTPHATILARIGLNPYNVSEELHQKYIVNNLKEMLLEKEIILEQENTGTKVSPQRKKELKDIVLDRVEMNINNKTLNSALINPLNGDERNDLLSRVKEDKNKKASHQIKLPEKIEKTLRGLENEYKTTTDEDKKKVLLEKINTFKNLSATASNLRKNIQSVHHNDEGSSFQHYDELCDYYMNYNLSRYGDAPLMRQGVVFEDDIDPTKITFANHAKSKNNNYLRNLWQPITMSGGNLEVTASVHYAKSSPISPAIAQTNLVKTKKLRIDEEQIEEIKKRMMNIGISTIEVTNGQYGESEISIDKLDNFIDRMRDGKIMVYRIDPKKKKNSDGIDLEEDENLIANSGLQLFLGSSTNKDRIDASKTTTRNLQMSDGSESSITGAGEPRIKGGKSGSYSQLINNKKSPSTKELGFDKVTSDINSFDAFSNSMTYLYGINRELITEVSDKFPRHMKSMNSEIEKVKEKLDEAEREGFSFVTQVGMENIIRCLNGAGLDVEGLLPDDDKNFGDEKKISEEADANVLEEDSKKLQKEAKSAESDEAKEIALKKALELSQEAERKRIEVAALEAERLKKELAESEAELARIEAEAQQTRDAEEANRLKEETEKLKAKLAKEAEEAELARQKVESDKVRSEELAEIARLAKEKELEAERVALKLKEDALAKETAEANMKAEEARKAEEAKLNNEVPQVNEIPQTSEEINNENINETNVQIENFNLTDEQSNAFTNEFKEMVWGYMSVASAVSVVEGNEYDYNSEIAQLREGIPSFVQTYVNDNGLSEEEDVYNLMKKLSSIADFEMKELEEELIHKNNTVLNDSVLVQYGNNMYQEMYSFISEIHSQDADRGSSELNPEQSNDIKRMFYKSMKDNYMSSAKNIELLWSRFQEVFKNTADEIYDANKTEEELHNDAMNTDGLIDNTAPVASPATNIDPSTEVAPVVPAPIQNGTGRRTRREEVSVDH
jgi:hypothetical protein